MKIVHINMTSLGSTGKIMLQIAKCARENGYDANTFSTHVWSKKYQKLPSPPQGHKYYGTYLENFVHCVLGKLFAKNGCYSYFATCRLIRQLKKYKPDVLHLHNLHGFCINLPLLFRYIKRNNVNTVWTLHDCWSFTGHCPHFVSVDCNKWKNQCHDCPLFKEYPKVYWDNSRQMYLHKKKWFTGVNNMIIVTPSLWLADLVKQSFLKDYPVKVINNGIDLNVFKPVESDFRKKYSCENKRIVLGVAFGWGKKKGLDVFLELAKRLDEQYQIVLVGTNEETDRLLPHNIISINRTQNQRELAEIYTAADVFVNPTREDTYPTVNMEAIACGTPVVTFKTGGSPEIVDKSCGSVVDVEDVDEMQKEIIRVCEDRPYSAEDCLERAKSFNMIDRFEEYVELYTEVTKV
jgi:glycosyltransferase involved in cell wall biosynthesis